MTICPGIEQSEMTERVRSRRNPLRLTTFASFPKGTAELPQSKPTALPAPSGREPLAKPEALCFSRKLYRYAKGPISEDDFPRPGEDVAQRQKGESVERSDDWGSFSTNIFSAQIACIPSKLLKNAGFFVR